jgi:hypothetical protein
MTLPFLRLDHSRRKLNRRRLWCATSPARLPPKKTEAVTLARSGRRASGPWHNPALADGGKGVHQQMQPTHDVATQCSASPPSWRRLHK